MNTCKCGAAAVVQWRRRLPAKPTTTEPVFACADHALSPALAGQVHEAACPGSGKCGCPPPAVEFPFPSSATPKKLPSGW